MAHPCIFSVTRRGRSPSHTKENNSRYQNKGSFWFTEQMINFRLVLFIVLFSVCIWTSLSQCNFFFFHPLCYYYYYYYYPLFHSQYVSLAGILTRVNDFDNMVNCHQTPMRAKSVTVTQMFIFKIHNSSVECVMFTTFFFFIHPIVNGGGRDSGVGRGGT